MNAKNRKIYLFALGIFMASMSLHYPLIGNVIIGMAEEEEIDDSTGSSETVPSKLGEYKARDFSSLIGMKGFSDGLLTTHFKLYEGYVKNTNLLREKIQTLIKRGKDRSPVYAGLKRMYGWEFDGMRLHEYYFENLGGNGELRPESPLYIQIAKQFGSYSAWRQDFLATGMIRGIGWAILYQDSRTGRLTNAWINEHDLGHLAGAKPLVVMDVWEHAYIVDYGINRNSYIDVFFNNLNWDIVNDRFINPS